VRSDNSSFKASEIRRPVHAISDTKVVYVIGRIDPLGANSEAARRRRSISSWVKMWHDRGRLGSLPKTAVGGTS